MLRGTKIPKMKGFPGIRLHPITTHNIYTHTHHVSDITCIHTHHPRHTHIHITPPHTHITHIHTHDENIHFTPVSHTHTYTHTHTRAGERVIRKTALHHTYGENQESSSPEELALARTETRLRKRLCVNKGHSCLARGASGSKRKTVICVPV